MSSKPNVLIVDQSLENLLHIEAILSRLEVTIFKAGGADDALRCLSGMDFAVILLKDEMSGSDGFETARLIRAHERNQDVPIIFLTALDLEQSAVQKAYELGAVDFLVKPFQPDILRWKVSVFTELSRKAKLKKELLLEQVARAESDAVALRACLLANASAALASSLDEDVMLGQLIKTLVPGFADCAALYRLDQERELRLVNFLDRDDAVCSERAAFRKHAVPLTDHQDILVQALEGRLPVPIVDIAEKTAAGSDCTPASSLENAGLRFGMFVPIRGWDKPLGVLALYRTAQRPFSASEQAVTEDLTGRIALAVTNAQLYEASQQAGRAKDRFLSVVSHELRTPLTAILGWVHILLSKSMDAEGVEKALRTIHRNVKLQNDLIGDILDFSRFSGGQFSIKFQDVEIQEILKRALETVRPLADQKKIRLVYRGDADAPVVAGDRTRLQQVFVNLAANAIKFTPEGGVVEIVFNTSESHAEVQVKDSGVGIQPEYIRQVFDPFMQADNSTTRCHPGLGLGLAIVRHLVELHGGVISAASPGSGQGSTFTVRLPVRRYEALAS